MKLRNLLIGMGSILDLCPAPRPLSRPKFMDRTDEEALASDWQAVGDGLRVAMKKMDEEIDNNA